MGANAADLMVFADDWGRHPSSCQHLVRRLRRDHRVLWVNSIGTRQVKANAFTLRRGLEKLNNWRQGLKKVDERMWVIDLPMLPDLGSAALRTLNRRLVTARLRGVLAALDMPAPHVVTTLPYVGWLIQGLRRRSLLYYCTDDFSHWPGADRETLQQAERELTGEADLILTASRALFRNHEHTGRCRYLPHGVDFNHFASVQHQKKLAPAVAALPRPRIGFFGLIYEKLNFDLLAALARRFTSGSLVLIGPVATCPPEFAALPNVHLLGRQPYEDLPCYLAGLDVLLMPYVMDDMIRQSGPLKLRECLASGKPTVSVDVPEVALLQPHVRVAADQVTFIEQVRQALEEDDDPARVQARQLAVAADGWDNRAEQFRAYLKELQPAARRTMTASANGTNGHVAPRRVLHLRTVSGRGGGPEKTLLTSPRFIDPRYQLRLAYIRPEGDPEYNMPERAQEMGADLVDIPERGAADPRTWTRLAREITQFRPDLLHAHDYKTNLLGVLLGRRFNIPVLTTLHGYVSRGGRLEVYYYLDRWSLRQMQHIVAVSEDLYDWLDELRVPAARRTLVHNAIDCAFYCPRHDRGAAKAKLGIPPARLVIGAVGRLAAEKGFDLLIRAVDQLARAGMDVGLVVLGDGGERPRLEALAGELGQTERVRLAGYQPDARPYYEAMDLFALSSLREGLPNVVLEAMAMGVPVVATRVAGVPRLIHDGDNGLLVEPGSVQLLTQALGRLAGDEGLRERLGRAGRETVETQFSFTERMRKIAALYDELLEKDHSCVRRTPK